MATPQLSPGVLVREVDLTVGRVDNVLDNIGAIAGPFALGPVNEVIEITNESDLLNTFGKPISTDGQFKYWLAASSFLSYGGILKVVRVDDPDLKNANVISGAASTSTLKIKNFEEYSSTQGEPEYIFAAQTPGTWANGAKVAVIDDKADQTIGISTNNLGSLGISVGDSVLTSVTSVSFPKPDGTQGFFTGNIKGVITGVTTSTTGSSSIDVKIISRVSSLNTTYEETYTALLTQDAGIGTTRLYVDGLPSNFSTTLNKVSTEVEDVDFVVSGFDALNGYIDISSPIGVAATTGDTLSILRKTYSIVSEERTNYKEGSSLDSINDNVSLEVVNSSGNVETVVSTGDSSDWYSNQVIRLSNGTIFWSSIAPKPSGNDYAIQRNCRGDAIHIAIFDDSGSITGIKGNLLEKHLFLSKGTDVKSTQNNPLSIWWRDYLSKYSSNIYGGNDPSDFEDTYRNVIPAFIDVTDNSFALKGSLWNAPCQDASFKTIGNVLYSLDGGNNYTISNGYLSGLDSIVQGYSKFSNKDEVAIDYLIMGPGLTTKVESQTKASYLISLAESRKDCIAVISPHESDVVNITNSETQTNNILAFFSNLPSSSYAVFDSGYKYTYDRFTGNFYYISCNPDVAGLMVRTSLNSYPWFSPAGQQRGIINNAIKLAYNPSKPQRDRLYSQRINSIITQSGSGTLLFGDKTAVSYATAFDRINVRRLFLTVEQAIESAAKSLLFELNDEITRSNFINIVEPYLRDIQAKRGVYDFLLVCDSTNNTPDVIDNNEFRADIYLKPTKSINYITLTFVATRTGVSFEEVAGRV